MKASPSSALPCWHTESFGGGASPLNPVDDVEPGAGKSACTSGRIRGPAAAIGAFGALAEEQGRTRANVLLYPPSAPPAAGAFLQVVSAFHPNSSGLPLALGIVLRARSAGTRPFPSHWSQGADWRLRPILGGFVSSDRPDPLQEGHISSAALAGFIGRICPRPGNLYVQRRPKKAQRINAVPGACCCANLTPAGAP